MYSFTEQTIKSYFVYKNNLNKSSVGKIAYIQKATYGKKHTIKQQLNSSFTEKKLTTKKKTYYIDTIYGFVKTPPNFGLLGGVPYHLSGCCCPGKS